MQVKNVHPINFLFYRTETKLSELGQLLPIGQELFQEAVVHKLPITGPIHWHYFGFEGDVSKSFTLEIALPVGEVLEEYDGKFHFKRTEPFKCLSLIHEGNWLDFPSTYGKAFQFMEAEQLRPISINREIYINVDFKNPVANVSEIQIGIE